MKFTIGRGGERMLGPTLFDGMALAVAEVPKPFEPPTAEAPPATMRRAPVVDASRRTYRVAG
jgi:transposase